MPDSRPLVACTRDYRFISAGMLVTFLRLSGHLGPFAALACGMARRSLRRGGTGTFPGRRRHASEWLASSAALAASV
ncbi:hypothetical protein RJ55_02032 [Drechmeria coniospora]|nr:hypothetical protein RJ55_02032 [Drechmeria coniospora]